MVLLPITMAAEAYDFSYNGFYYNILSENDRTVEVTYVSQYTNYSGNVVIPSEAVFDNKVYTVIAIGEYAFQNDTGVKAVTIPFSVTTIDRSAFQSCSSLTSVTIPNSVTSIGESAFEG